MDLMVTVTVKFEDNCFVAYCEEYNLSARNTTIEDTLADLQKSLQEYLQDEHCSAEVSIVLIIKKLI